MMMDMMDGAVDSFAAACDKLSGAAEGKIETRRRQERERDEAALGAEFGGRMGGMGGGGFAGKAFYRDLDSTKQWAESHWDRVRTVGGPPPASLIDTDPFWLDLASGELDSIGVSSNLLRPVGNRHAALVALAMCGLPLKAGEVGLPTEPNQKYSPAHAVAVVTKRLKLLEAAEEESSILVGQRFARLDQVDNKKKPSEEPNEFLIGIAYQGQTVISNPTAERQIVDVFWQIPAGSIAAGRQSSGPIAAPSRWNRLPSKRFSTSSISRPPANTSTIQRPLPSMAS